MASAKSARTNCGITLVEPRPCERAEDATWCAWAEGTPCAISAAWALTQRQVLEAAGIAPPSVELEETDLNATRWVEQGNVDWILITPSLVGSHRDDVIKPLQPEVLVPYTLQWNPDRAQTPAVARFVHTALTVDPPAGWRRQPGHLRHATPW
jgi:hypothetical protein